MMPGMPSEAELQRANAGPGVMKTASFAYDARAPDEFRCAGFTTAPTSTLPLPCRFVCRRTAAHVLRRRRSYFLDRLVENCVRSQHQHSSSVEVEDKIKSDDARLIPVSKREH
jgi:hypothetical protein